MSDLIYVAILMAFFLVSVLLARFCAGLSSDRGRR
jgi:hypothetical protein